MASHALQCSARVALGPICAVSLRQAFGPVATLGPIRANPSHERTKEEREGATSTCRGELRLPGR